MHFLRQPAYYFVSNLFPTLPFILPALNIPVKIGNDTIIAIIDQVKFASAVVPNSNLQKRFQTLNFFQCIIHNAGMRVGKAAVTYP